VLLQYKGYFWISTSTRDQIVFSNVLRYVDDGLCKLEYLERYINASPSMFKRIEDNISENRDGDNSVDVGNSVDGGNSVDVSNSGDVSNFDNYGNFSGNVKNGLITYILDEDLSEDEELTYVLTENFSDGEIEEENVREENHGDGSETQQINESGSENEEKTEKDTQDLMDEETSD
jgi:hypothetical protein